MSRLVPLIPALAIALATLAMAAPPLAAQTRPPDPELLRLIPEAAVADPQAWAKAVPNQTAPNSTPPPAEAELTPTSPLGELPGGALAWPEPELALPPLALIPPDPAIAATLAATVPALPPRKASATNARVTSRVSLGFPEGVALPERGELETRFKALSALAGLSGKAADNLGQIAVRAASDRLLLLQLLRIYGYYDGEVLQTLGGDTAAGGAASPAAARVHFDIVPGARYAFGAIDLGALASAGPDTPQLRAAFDIHTGDPLHADAVTGATSHLDVALGEAGYPFAKIGTPDLLVDHRREAGDLALPVTPGGKYRFGGVTSSDPHFLPAPHLARIARFKPGQVWQRSLTDDLHRAILATGLVSSLTVTPRETTPPVGETPGIVDLDVKLTRAPVHTVAGAIGYDTGEGFRLEASWEHRNLFPPEGLLRLRGIAGTNEQLLGATFRRNNFGGRDRVLTADLYADNANLTAYAARKLAFSVNFERLTTLIFQKPWSWSAGFEAEYSAEREGLISGITTGRTTYATIAVPLRAAFDASDDLLDPRRGWRAALRVSPELSHVGSATNSYARLQGDASLYLPFGKTLVLAARARLGSIVGAPLGSIAPSRRFYAGGGGSIRGFGYELVGPRNAAGDPKGGRSLYEFSIEARVHTGLFGGALSLVPFVDAGGADTGELPQFADPRIGVGLGLRYQTGFGPIRIDVGTPLGRRPGESVVGVTVALGQSF